MAKKSGQIVFKNGVPLYKYSCPKRSIISYVRKNIIHVLLFNYSVLQSDQSLGYKILTPSCRKANYLPEEIMKQT